MNKQKSKKQITFFGTSSIDGPGSKSRPAILSPCRAFFMDTNVETNVKSRHYSRNAWSLCGLRETRRLIESSATTHCDSDSLQPYCIIPAKVLQVGKKGLHLNCVPLGSTVSVRSIYYFTQLFSFLFFLRRKNSSLYFAFFAKCREILSRLQDGTD
jgi:hypothetical protein